MRKMFTRLFSLALLVMLLSTVTVVKAQNDCGPTISASDVVLVTDITTVCDSDLVQYKVTGYPDAKFAFNWDGDPDDVGGYTADSTFWVTEGVGFTVRVLVNDTCYSNELDLAGQDTIQQVLIDSMAAEHPQCWDDQGEVTIYFEGSHPPHTVYFVDSVNWVGPAGDYSDYAYEGGTQFAAAGGWYYAAVQGVNPDCGVSEWDSVYVNYPPDVVEITQFEASTDSVLCRGDSVDIIVNVIGGTPYADGSYDITIGGMTVTEIVPAVISVPAGSYTVSVEDSLGCPGNLDSTLVIVQPDEITFDIAIVDVSCGDTTTKDGVIKVFNIEPAGVAYTAWVGGGSPVSMTGDTIFIEDLSPIYYSLYVGNPCMDTAEYDNPNGTGNVVSVQSPEDLHYEVVYNDTIICYGDSTWVTIENLTGGSGNYEFSFDGEMWQDTAWAWYVEAGDYTLSVRDADETDCELAWPEDIEIDQLMPVHFNGWDEVEPTCTGGNDGLLKIYAAGGTGEYEYSINGNDWYVDNVFNVRGGRNYDIYVRDANCPHLTDEYEIYVDDAYHYIDYLVSADTVVCEGETSEGVRGYGYWSGIDYDDNRYLSAYVTTDVDSVYLAGEQIGAYANWYDEFYFYFYPYHLDEDVIAPGTYYIWIEDSYGCKLDQDGDGEADYFTFTVREQELATVTATVTEVASCYESNDGKITLKLDGEPAMDGYDIYYALANTKAKAENMEMDEYGLEWPEGADSVNINVSKGTYFAVVWDEFCNDTTRFISDSIIVAGYDELLVGDTISTTHNICYGDSSGVIEFEAATGGSGELVYSLHEYMGDVIEEYDSVTTTIFTGLPEGWYVLEVIDLNGCEGDMSEPIIITQPKEAVDFSMDYEHISCFGASDGKVFIDAYGGVSGDYEFKIGAAPWLAFPADSDKKTVVITEPGTYQVWVRDADSPECPSEPQTVVINQPLPLMLDVDVTDVTASCLEDPNGKLEITVTGGNVGVDFDIYVNDIMVGSHEDSAYTVVLTDLAAGNYEIVAIENHGRECEISTEVVINQPDSLIGVAVIVDSVHCNGSDEGIIEVTSVSGGTAPYELILSESAVAIDTITYDADGENVFEMLVAGSYSVTVVDAEGCESNINNLDISEPTELELEATWIQDITCLDSGMFSIQASGGVGNYEYYAALADPVTGHILIEDIPAVDGDEWVSDSVFSVKMAGTWVVWAKDANNCIIGGEYDENDQPVNEWRVQIEEPAFVVTFDIDVEDPIQCNGETTADVIVSNVVVTENETPLVDPEVTVEIDGVEMDTLENVGAGVYYITVTHDATGCSTMDSVEVTEPKELVAVLDKAEGMFTCPDETEGYIEVTVTDSSTAPFEYQLWQSGNLKTDYQEDNSFLVQTGKSYTVVVMDDNGCTDTTNTLQIIPVEPITFDMMDVTCSGDTAASVKVSVQGEEGRKFKVMWRQYEIESAPHFGETGWYEEGDIILDQIFKFDNESDDDQHYEVYVVDSMGCESAKDSVTFDQVISDELTVTVVAGDVDGCGTEVTITPAGGVAPYTVMVGDEVITDDMVVLGGGMHYITVYDAHECAAMDTITLEYPMSMDTTLVTYTGEAVQFVYAEAMLDTMLYAGDYTFIYNMDSVCTAEINVTVDEKDRSMPDLVSVSPVDTLEDNHPTFVITFDGPIAFNDSVTGNLTVTVKDSTEEYLTIPITSTMVDPVAGTITVTYEVAEGELGLDKNTTYTVAVDSGVVVGDGLTWDGDVAGELGEEWMFTTGPDWATGVEPGFETLEFAVYPNPFNDFIRIDNADKLDRVVVSNIAGQRILDIEYPSYEIRTGNLVTGVYVVTLIADDEIVKSERIIKR
ncbi:T9SS type A sorting domain-containing protein [uncultured Draconibacterium sp.]|uniref:T9SS type A sorting domain-containing protein n=1 Tax=uncultured Draconibacterium sp. TaxID=1573823 RepID=UPI0025FF33B4|nr:T9SS type A sorting domain-containing protein [uncultured Draconibacterium sp.]